MRKNWKMRNEAKAGCLPVLFLALNACIGTETKKPANAKISLHAVKQDGEPAALYATFPPAVDNPNLKVVDSTVAVSITGNIVWNGKDTVVEKFPFPADYRKVGAAFIFDFPESLEPGEESVAFIGSAKDETGFASSDTVEFVDKCPLDASPGDYVDPNCP